MLKRRLSSAVLGLAAASFISSAVVAQDYPNRPITLVVPFAAGGGTDIQARKVADGISKALGQPVVVENKPGAGSLIGVQYAAQQKPDGYTLLMMSSSYVTNVVLGEGKPYDPAADFEPVTMVSISPTALVTHPSVKAETLKEFIDLAKSEPGLINYGTFGDRSQPHLSAVLFGAEAGLEMNAIPYNGGGPAVTAVVSGEVDMLMPTIMLVQPHVESGALRALAIASSVRSPLAPEVPTFAEAGFPFEMGTWFGIAAPAGTDPEIVKKVSDAAIGFLTTDDMRKEIESEGSVLLALDPAKTKAFIADEIERWTKVKELGLF